MADGVRLQPQPGRVVPDNAMVVVRDITRPVTPGDPCGVCGVPHDCKTYHLQLHDGTVIVSTTVWDNLQKLYDCGGFEPVNVVSEPPSQGLLVPSATVKIRPAEF